MVFRIRNMGEKRCDLIKDLKTPVEDVIEWEGDAICEEYPHGRNKTSRDYDKPGEGNNQKISQYSCPGNLMKVVCH